MGFTGDEQLRPWNVNDAPERYVDILMQNIVGIEINVHRLEGKFKMSQEMRRKDRVGVINGLRQMQSESGMAVALKVEEKGSFKFLETSDEA